MGTLIGLYLVYETSTDTPHYLRYFSLLLPWASFPFIFQVLTAGDIFTHDAWFIIKLVLSMGSWFSLTDLFATSVGAWDLNEEYTYPFRIVNLPLEKIFFFMITSLLIVGTHTIVQRTWEKALMSIEVGREGVDLMMMFSTLLPRNFNAFGVIKARNRRV